MDAELVVKATKWICCGQALDLVVAKGKAIGLPSDDNPAVSVIAAGLRGCEPIGAPTLIRSVVDRWVEASPSNAVGAPVGEMVEHILGFDRCRVGYDPGAGGAVWCSENSLEVV